MQISPSLMEVTLRQLGVELTNSPQPHDSIEMRVWQTRNAQLAAVNMCQLRSSQKSRDLSE